VEGIELRTLSPLDMDTFLELVATTSRAVTVHEDNRILDIGVEASAVIANQVIECLAAPILQAKAPDVPLVPAAVELEHVCTLSMEQIFAAIERTVDD
jgi:pyruvate/2-oxoglutarate/acetoin dehydrogenase E1 component